MEPYEDEGFKESKEQRALANRWLGIGFIALLVITGIATALLTLRGSGVERLAVVKVMS